MLFPPSLCSIVLEVMEKIIILNGYRRRRTHTSPTTLSIDHPSYFPSTFFRLFSTYITKPVVTRSVDVVLSMK